MLEGAVLVDFEHEWTNLSQFALLLIDYGDHVESLGCQVIECAKVDVLQAHVDEVTELLGILEVTIINKFHQQEIIEEKLSLWVQHDL